MHTTREKGIPCGVDGAPLVCSKVIVVVVIFVVVTGCVVSGMVGAIVVDILVENMGFAEVILVGSFVVRDGIDGVLVVYDGDELGYSISAQ